MPETPVRVLYLSASETPIPAIQNAFSSHEQFELHTFLSPEKALAATEWQPIDCILVSATHPESYRTDFLEPVNNRHSTCPVVLYFDGDTPVSYELVERLDADDFLCLTDDDSFAPQIRARVECLLTNHETDQELARHRDFLDRIQPLADVGGWEYDVDQGALRWTEQVYDIYEVPKTFEPTVDRALEFYHPDDRPSIEAAVTRLIREGDPFEFETRLVTGEDSIKWVLIRGDAKIVEENVTLVRGTIRDITDHVDRRTALSTTRSELEKERDRLAKLAQVLAHELRNPITAAHGQLELYQEYSRPAHLTSVSEQLERLETVIDDVLWLVNQDEGVGDISMVDIQEVAQETWTGITAGDVELEVVPFEKVPGNRSLLRIILEKLFQNAIDHGSPTQIWLTPQYTNGQLTGFSVSDDGDGLANDGADIFELGMSTSGTGSGVGLAVVTEIVARHGWTIEVAESDYGGARFEIGGLASEEVSNEETLSSDTDSPPADEKSSKQP